MIVFPPRTVGSCESLSRLQRELTPLALAQWLIDQVSPSDVLWTSRKSFYNRFPVKTWNGHNRDANQYEGPGPIICHPPCGPWGKYRHRNVWHSGDDGINAMRFVHTYGGVVEQPKGSALFTIYGRPDARIIEIDQSDFGHAARKPTLLYFHPGGVNGIR